jgi:transposase
MVEHIPEVSAPRGRIEIRTGIGRRRRWPDREKARIVAESFAPGAVVSEIARRYEITPQHLFVWRKAVREGRLALPEDATPPFVPVINLVPTGQSAKLNGPAIAIEIAGTVVRADPGVDLGWLRDVLRVVKAAL